MSNQLLDCQTCGACCAPRVGVANKMNSATYAELAPGDYGQVVKRYGKQVALRLLVRERREEHTGVRLATCGPVCAALAGEVGEKVACEIYAARPRVCREFEPGSMMCQMARHERGLRA